MKNIALFLLIVSLSSCGFYKRQYTSGWMHSNRPVAHNNKLTTATPRTELIANIENELPNVITQTMVTDTIVPDNTTAPPYSIEPEKKEEEQDFYTPKEGQYDKSQNASDTYGEELAKKTFEKRVKNASRGLKMMLIGFGYFILALALEFNGVANPEIWTAISIIGLIASMVSFIFMFYFTYKSFDIQINNPDVIFDRRFKSKLILPAILSILLTGWIGIIFALVLVIKNSSRRNRRK
ncbi:MAG: hypothetical protein RLY35_1387 [Bacteroidota bacterium]|jgi:hypothetical protein